MREAGKRGGGRRKARGCRQDDGVGEGSALFLLPQQLHCAGLDERVSHALDEHTTYTTLLTHGNPLRQ
jgi:hypothetical protein